MSEEKPVTCKITGNITEILPVEVITTQRGEFRKQYVIVHIPGEYPKDVAVLFKQKAIEKLQGVSAGQMATILCDVESREWKGKYFTDVSGFHISVQGGSKKSTPNKQAEAEPEGDPFEDGDAPF